MLRLGPKVLVQRVSKIWIYLQLLVYIFMPWCYLALKILNIYQTNTSVHGMNTRQQHKLHIPSVRLTWMQRGVYYSSVKIFNQCPQNIFKFCNNIHTLKTLLRDYLVKNAFCSIDESLSTGHDSWLTINILHLCSVFF